MSEPLQLWAWRHPRPEGAAGRCVGASSDLPVHWRRAKRLARHIQATARRQGLPHCIHTSPLARCRDVGSWLRRWGWRHVVDRALLELDFGAWDGKTWPAIGQAAVDAWCADFAAHRPGGGESLQDLLRRARGWQTGGGPALLVTHGGWVLARGWAGAAPSRAADWPAAPRYGELRRLA
ncbi:MAG TPA: histidine phosphatase family protein [Roseateles sp.]|nr:histidine phosphatase family protein [Roseateles sp.]